ncbi:FAD-binding oxidoreductase [Pseudonocardia alaniniphila]|uniref:FAD-binding oxidoreductase n=1 Tax=Pseudonocardia alaniniphila TaxID=75291 RepID=A0ABS9TUM0_9PSEU|nr:FAD-binding oxidoreductase [Pseudonocardia alaniniphila]MCH6172255.1 FAD-binding oxidoreductase [Pseudonocardia alaniniphila]
MTTASGGPPSPGPWQTARVTGIRRETPTAKTFTLTLPQPRSFWAGQYYVVRLTAPDGYRAQRSYSIASAPSDSAEVDLTVEILPGGEVSGFLNEAVEEGDMLDVRGPIGGNFAWNLQPALGVAGGSGIVPLMSMLRHARRLGRPGLFRLVVSVRSPEDLYYSAEIQGPDASIVFTRTAPDGHVRPPERLMARDLAAALDVDRDVYVCGSTAFCDAATRLVEAAGVPAERIRVERFGFSG